MSEVKMGFMKYQKPIAIACYNMGKELYSKRLYSEREIELVQQEGDEDVGGEKVIIVRGENLSVESLT